MTNANIFYKIKRVSKSKTRTNPLTDAYQNNLGYDTVQFESS